jgi:hypothetical protein
LWDFAGDGNMAITKQSDSKGRILLGSAFAGATFLMETQKDGTLILRPAVTVPINEEWLWKNKKALASVMNGLEQARDGKLVKGPDLKADLALFEDNE